MNTTKRHGDFDSLPHAYRTMTVREAKAQFPAAFAELEPDELARFNDDASVEVEDTGAMSAYNATGTGAHWVYFPGEGWDAY